MLDYNEFNLYLIRHGQSAVNVLPDQMGQAPDVPLTEHGKEQARLLGQRLQKEVGGFHHIFSSPYTRAFDTAKIVLPQQYHNSIVICSDLREYSAGNWEGAKRSQTMTSEVVVRMGYMASGFQPPGGESMHQVERRVSRWLEDNILYNSQIQKEAYDYRHVHYPDHKHPNMNIAVFSHGMTIKCLLHYIMGFDQSFIWKLTLENTSICKLVFNREGWRLITINDHAHLL